MGKMPILAICLGAGACQVPDRFWTPGDYVSPFQEARFEARRLERRRPRRGWILRARRLDPDLQTLYEAMASPDEALRDAVADWYRKRHEGEEGLEAVIQRAELMTRVTRQGLARILLRHRGEEDEALKEPRLGLPRPAR